MNNTSAPSIPARGMVFEVVTVLCVAILPWILTALVMVLWPDANNPLAHSGSLFRILYSSLCLLLVAYVVYQRGDSPQHFGLVLRLRSIPMAVVLFITARIAFVAAQYFLGTLGVDFGVMFAQSGVPVSRSRGLLYVVRLMFGAAFEEFIMRAYFMTRLKDLGCSSATAVILSTMLQTSYHLYYGPIECLAFVPSFVIYSLYFARFGNVPTLILAHLFTNLCVRYL